MFKNYQLRNYNFKLVLLVLVATAFGTVVIHSADSSYTNKQIIGLVGCLVIMIGMSLVDYHLYVKYWYILYGLNLIMLLGIIPFGKTVNNARRWYSLGEFATFQPSELSKICMIVCLAAVLSKIIEKEKLNHPAGLGIIAAFCAVPMLVIVKQPDLSTTIDLFLILLAMIFVAGLSWKIIGVTALVTVPLLNLFLWYIQRPDQKLLKDYQVGRILERIYPQDYAMSTGWQQTNSVMAIGSGMLTGKGLHSDTLATVKDANLISEQQTDFIFSVVGEELGFIGCAFIIGILFLIVVLCIRVARKAGDREGMLIASGVAALFCFQTFINIAVATQILPNTGLPLPFVSYGISSLLSSCMGIGIVLNVALQRKRNTDR